MTAEQITEAAKYGVPVAFENSLRMRFVLIPAGIFSMGSPMTESGRRSDETQHDVTISRPFYLQSTEVTNAQLGRCDVARVKEEVAVPGVYGGLSLAASTQPGAHLSWEAARAFARWLSDGVRRRSYALPTEAQWEYACRAGSTSSFWWGSSQEEGARCSNVADPRTKAWLGLTWDGWHVNDGYRVSAPVASFRSNAWGVYDMAGNVREWCADWYSPHTGGPVTDPRGPPEGTERVVRGGSWLFGPEFARSAARLHDDPTVRSSQLGFRLICEVPEPGDVR